MPAIDIGSTAINRGSNNAVANRTWIDRNNPANLDGIITSYRVWFANTNGENVKVGTFYGAPDDFINRDGETLGDVSAGSEQIFNGLNCDVIADDVIGFYSSAGVLEVDTSGGVNMHYKAADQFGAGLQIV